MWCEDIFLFSFHIHNFEPCKKKMNPVWLCYGISPEIIRVVIVLLLPFLSPHPALFTFDVSESFVWLHLWPNFLILPFLTFHFPRSKGPCCINVTAFSEFRGKSQQHKPCHGTERVCAAAFAFSHPPPSKSPRVPTLCSSVSTFSPLWLPGLASFFMMPSTVPLALGPCTRYVVLGKTHLLSEPQFPYLFPSSQQRQQQMLCSVPERVTVMCTIDFSLASCRKMEQRMSSSRGKWQKIRKVMGHELPRCTYLGAQKVSLLQ